MLCPAALLLNVLGAIKYAAVKPSMLGKNFSTGGTLVERICADTLAANAVFRFGRMQVQLTAGELTRAQGVVVMVN